MVVRQATAQLKASVAEHFYIRSCQARSTSLLVSVLYHVHLIACVRVCVCVCVGGGGQYNVVFEELCRQTASHCPKVAECVPSHTHTRHSHKSYALTPPHSAATVRGHVRTIAGCCCGCGTI